MNNESLLKRFYAREISIDQYVQMYYSGRSPTDDLLLETFANAIYKKDAYLVEDIVVLLSSKYFTNSKFTTSLCELLLVNWHFKHEDIVSLLANIKDPNSVNYLYEATKLSLGYLEFDDTYQLARKCIKALAVIASNRAIDKLRLISNSDIEVIAGYAKKELIRLA